jgi:hypothetical protein
LDDGHLGTAPRSIRTPDLSSWEVRALYKTAAECHAAIGTLARQPTTNSEILAAPLIVTDPEGYRAIRNQVFERALCIASDDPRLSK